MAIVSREKLELRKKISEKTLDKFFVALYYRAVSFSRTSLSLHKLAKGLLTNTDFMWSAFHSERVLPNHNLSIQEVGKRPQFGI
jgi:hypothetical protein